MARQARVFIFGDQSQDTTGKIRTLLNIRENPVLASFLEQSYDAIRSEIGRQPLAERRSLPRFHNLADMVARQREGVLSPAFQTALACINQLADFFQHFAKPGMAYPSSADTYMLGLCTGALAAAPISCACSVTDLLPAAVQAVSVAFRLGLMVVEMAKRIEPGACTESWSLLFPGLLRNVVTPALKDFCDSRSLPPQSRPWISACLPNGTSISGPPRVLRQLCAYGPFAKVRTLEIPVRVPGHAGHLFTMDDISNILATTDEAAWTGYQLQMPLCSAVTGKLMPPLCGYRALLEACLVEILLHPLRWDNINDEFPAVLKSSGVTDIKLTPMMTTTEHAVQQTLGSHTAFTSVVIDTLQNDDAVRRSNINKTGKPELSKLAIVGFSGRFPDASTPAEFWEILRTGTDTVRKVPAKRWNVDTHVDFSGRENTGEVPWGCFVPNPGLFDARFFQISPKEAPQIDPAQRIALMTTYEAMENAGIVPGTTPSTKTDRIGVFHGVTSNDYMETNTAQCIDTHFIIGGNRAFIPGRINFCFEFCGPSYSVDTACSSSLTAMHIACNALWRGDVDTAVSSGTNMINNPDGHTGLDRGFFLSKTGNCKTFDDGADGYCRGEGIVTTIIKRLEDALADNDPILAVISGTMTNHSAESDSIMRPDPDAQKILFDKLLNATGTDHNELSYIEMHGTGTQVGDAVEMESVLDIFGPAPKTVRARRDDSPLYLGAAKSNIGHGEGVSGVTSVAKVLLMYQKNMIPPHAGIKTKINHNYPLDMDARNVHIAFKETPWLRDQGKPRKVLINNFSAAGGNTALLLEDAPDRMLNTDDNRTLGTNVLAISAKSANSLKGNLQSMLDYIKNPNPNPLYSLARLSYTSTARRLHHMHRVMVRGGDVLEVTQRLEEAIARGDGLTRVKAPPKVVFAFTGQGSQYCGMGKQTFETFSSFRADILRYDQIARGQGFPSFKHIICANKENGNDAEDSDANKADLFTSQVFQLAICCLEMALARLWISWGIMPKAVIGHSLGEYAALNVAGVLSDSDTIYLVGKRAEILQEECRVGTHAMLAVKASVARIPEVLGDVKFQVSCINGPEDTVLGGPVAQIKSMQELFAAQNIKATLLELPYAFHTSQVFSILGDFEAAAKGVTFYAPTVPVLSPLLGAVVTGDDTGIFHPKYLARHCRETVNMHGALQAGQAAGLLAPEKSVVLEIGPHPVASGMVKATLGTSTRTLPTLQKGKDFWPNFTAALTMFYTQNMDIKWQEYYQDMPDDQKVPLELPAYSWDLKEYWVQYENDWSITKGKPDPNAVMTGNALPTVECTAIHRLVKESSDGETAQVVVETDISREDIHAIAKGHMVNNIALTTPSVYAEVGFSLGTYLLNRFRPPYYVPNKTIVDVSGLVVEKALIPHGRGPQLLHTSATIDWAARTARLTFRSVTTSDFRPTTEHGSCTLRFTDTSQRAAVQAHVPHFMARMARLREGISSGQSVRLNQAYGYKLISCLAQFHPDYRAIDEVVLDSGTLEAYSTCSFGQVKSQGAFAVAHPAYIDVMTQTAGFIMNGKETTDLDKEVYVNHGWTSLQVFEELSPKKVYTTYVQMSQSKDDPAFWNGNTVLLEGDRVVGFFKDVTLRCISRTVFHRVLDASGSATSKKLAIAAAPAAPIVKPSPPASAAPITKTAPAPAPALAPMPARPQPVPVQAAKPTTYVAAKAKESHIGPALNIIAEETGLAVADLTDDSAFADVGVDSLLSMVITSRFREELGLDLDLEFSLFLDLPTIKHLRDFLEDGQEDTTEDSSEASMPDADLVVITPPSEELLAPPVLIITEASMEKINTRAAGYGASVIPEGALAAALGVIAEESGLAVEDLTDDTAFADIGIDSLLSMVITSRFREELGMDLDLEFSLFLDLPTVLHLRQFLEPTAAVPSSSSSSSGEETIASSLSSPTPESTDWGYTPMSEISAFEPEIKMRPSCYCRPATSVILQGLPNKTSRTLFLFPDGGGSSSSYEPLPRLPAALDTAIIGFNCPFVRDPHNLRCNIDDLMGAYLNELRARQPTGPYHLGGWSSGGIFAFLAARRLLAEGEEVHTLAIIDSPVPRVMDKLPEPFYEYCDRAGLFGYATGNAGAPAPPWLIPHFHASVDVLHGCTFGPLAGVEPERMPRTGIIWAVDSVLKSQEHVPWARDLMAGGGGLRDAHFLVKSRDDFGPCGWDKMLPGADVMTDRVEAANHFSMMQKPFINQVGRFLEQMLQ